jgi:hypothetical protein
VAAVAISWLQDPQLNRQVSAYLLERQQAWLVRLASGERAIVSGGPGGIDFPRGAVSRVIAHTHSYGTGATAPSPADFAMLDEYGQKSS